MQTDRLDESSCLYIACVYVRSYSHVVENDLHKQQWRILGDVGDLMTHHCSL